MNDFIFVDAIEALADLANDHLAKIFRYFLSFPEEGIKLSRNAQLQHQINRLRLHILEEGIELNNVRVIQKHLYFYFTNKLSHQNLVQG